MERLALMPKYEDYVDSGVEWLGDLPSHWDAVKMKFLFKDTSMKNKPNETLLSVTQSQGVVPREWVENRMVMPSGNLESFKFIAKGDFAISLRSFEGGLEYCHHDGIISPAYTVLKTKKDYLLAGYYKYLFKSQTFISELQTSIVGIREGKNISYEELQYSLLPIPAEEEQTRIANFLDKKTALIDEAISIKEQQISLLKERKQIIIQQAVTQGLDPNVPMKDSGVDWIGDIPEHWEVVPLKRLAVLSPSVKVSNRKSKELVTFLAMEKVSTDGFIDQDTLMPICDVSQGFTVFNRGDVIVAKITPCFENGKSAWLNNLQTEFGYGSTEFHVLRCGQRIIGSFLYLIVSSPLFLNAGEAMMTGSAGQKRVPSSFIQNFPTAIPGVAEQEKIVSKVKELFSQIDVVVASTVNQIEKLKEYKTTLINSAVTGKIKITPEMVEQ
ncbi:TPA: restriction endonuclease subunit S [Escherichia coli]|uniref:restriction endonuclease subunit S n=1 Tax=Escherichia coli TaxID=562 RepID=UPI0004D79FBB|nr:restriction endonuclease subunit S [Escherichia coli]KDV80195.1 type I restriction modification DNA specificity domain protein [Escherichia coli 2-052-05_S4_C3]UZR92171.1 restriction endonuclease subunit S [Escherichia coli]HCJ5989709.1 restriction endonuclease subunit S [Escherichia coli]